MPTEKKIIFCSLLLLWLFLNISGGILIKYTAIYHEKLWLLLFLFALLLGTFGARAVVSLVLGQKYQLSYVYPFLGLNYIFSVVVGIILFNEQFIWQRFAGCLIILAGVTLLMFSKNKDEKVS